MTEKEVYKELAQRYIHSAKQQIAHGFNIEEVIAFIGYHAFECLCSAVIVHFNYQSPKNHEKKLNVFLKLCKKHLGNSINLRAISLTVLRLDGVRNKFLYPESQAGNMFKSPKEQFTITEVKLLIRDVDKIINQIINVI